MQSKQGQPLLIVTVHISKNKKECLEIFSDKPSKIEESIVTFIKKHQIKYSALSHLKNIIYEQFKNLQNNSIENQRGRQNQMESFNSQILVQRKQFEKVQTVNKHKQYDDKQQSNILPLTLKNNSINKIHNRNLKPKQQFFKSKFHTKCKIAHKNRPVNNKSVDTKPKPDIQKSSEKNKQDINKSIDLSVNLPIKKNHNRNITYDTPKINELSIIDAKENDQTQKYKLFTIDDLQSQINAQMKSILFQKFIDKRESGLYNLFCKLTRNNPAQIKYIHPQYVDFSVLSQQQLVGLQLFFDKLSGEKIDNITYEQFKRLVIEKEADCIIRILQLYY